MLVFVDTTNGSTLPIELNSWDRVMDMKKKIEKSQGIAVSSQELYFKGQALLIDDIDLKICNIVNFSRLLLVLPDEDYYQVLLQTEQSPPPSNYITNIEDSLGKNQGWPVTTTTLHQTEHYRVPPSYAIEAFDNQGLPAMAWSNNDQMLHQTEQSPVPQAFFNQASPAMARSNNDQMLQITEQSMVPSNVLHQTAQSPVPQAFFSQGSPAMARNNDDQELLFPDMPVRTEDISKMQSWTAQGNVNIQEPSGRNDSNQDLFQRESSHPSKTFGDFSFGEDRFLSAKHVTNSKSYLPASTIEEIITEQAPPPSNIEDSLGKNQGWPMVARSNNPQMLHQTEHSQGPPSNILEAFFDKDRPEMVRSIDDQMLHQTEKSLLSSCSIDELLHLVPETPLTDQDMRKMQGDWPESATERSVNIQESSERNDNNQDLLQRESSNSFGDFSFIEFPLSAERFSDISYFPAITTGDIITENQVLQTGETPVPSHSTEQRINTQDLPVRVESTDQVVQSEKSPPIREVINIPDSPVKVRILKKPPQKLRVMVLPYSPENKPVSKFPVNVNASEKVGELRKELEKIQQRTPLDLPPKGYFFIHKQRMLDDAQSFSWNGVAHGDMIEIISGHVTN